MEIISKIEVKHTREKIFFKNQEWTNGKSELSNICLVIIENKVREKKMK